MITIVSLNIGIVKAVKEVFPEQEYPEINVIRSNISQCSGHDCIVSAGNSFGLMDGGIDRTITNMLSTIDDRTYIIGKVQQRIIHEYSGEQPVGTCILVPTDNIKFPFLAHVPTMRIPRNSIGTLNAYYAYKSLFEKVRQTPQINSILTTTFCTGCGEIPLRMSLEQMKKAYNMVFRSNLQNIRWSHAAKLDEELVELQNKNPKLFMSKEKQINN